MCYNILRYPISSGGIRLADSEELIIGNGDSDFDASIGKCEKHTAVGIV